MNNIRTCLSPNVLKLSFSNRTTPQTTPHPILACLCASSATPAILDLSEDTMVTCQPTPIVFNFHSSLNPFGNLANYLQFGNS